MAGVAAIYVARLALSVPLRARKAMLSGIAPFAPSILAFDAPTGQWIISATCAACETLVTPFAHVTVMIINCVAH